MCFSYMEERRGGFLSSLSSWSFLSSGQQRMIREDKRSDQRTSLCPHKAANGCDSPMEREEELEPSWQEKLKKYGKSLEAERGREERPCSELSGDGRRL